MDERLERAEARAKERGIFVGAIYKDSQGKEFVVKSFEVDMKDIAFDVFVVLESVEESQITKTYMRSFDKKFKAA